MKMEDLSKKREIFELETEPGNILEFSKVFGNSNPVHLEIGSGRGEYLLRKALEHPEINFLALELKEKRIKTILRKLEPGKTDNVRIIRFFVDEEVTQVIPAGSFEFIYIIHPDPWPKKRHNRRRLIQHKFIDVLHQLLRANGAIKFSTDHLDYAMWITLHFLERDDFSTIYKNGFTRTAPSDHVETYFEKLKREEGFPPFYMEYRKLEQ
jgi:tRNA (guanine-N7-)-methyltransferase